MAGRIGLKAMANFCKQASIAMRSGLSISRAFPVMARETKDRRLRRALRDLAADIEGGSTLGDALRKRHKRYPDIFVEMVNAGEHTGHLDEVFARLADYFDMRLMLRRATIRASIYPIIQLTMAYAVFCLIAILFSPNKMAMAEMLAMYTIGAFAAVMITLWFFGHTLIGRAIWDRLAVTIPLMRYVTIKLCMARFTRTLAMQLDSGISVTDAIERAALVTGNGVVAKNLARIAEPIRRGTSLAEAVKKSRLMTPMIKEVLSVGEETGDFGEALNRIAAIYEDESLTVLESIPKFIGPIVAIIVGIVVIYLFYTVYFVHYLKPLLEMVGV